MGVGPRIDGFRARYEEAELGMILREPAPFFIHLLFTILLKRPADEPSVTHYLELERRRPAGRQAVLLDIYNSDEARAASVGVAGIARLALAVEEASSKRPRVFVPARELVPPDRSLRGLFERFKVEMGTPESRASARATATSRHALLGLAYEVIARSSRGAELKLIEVDEIDRHLREDDVPALYAYGRIVKQRASPSRRSFCEDDFRELAAFGDDGDFLIAAYEQVLGRQPDTGGFLGALIALRSGATDRASVAQSLAVSAEARARDVRLYA